MSEQRVKKVGETHTNYECENCLGTGGMYEDELESSPLEECRRELAAARAALIWIKNDLSYKAPEQVAPEVAERIVERIERALDALPPGGSNAT